MKKRDIIILILVSIFLGILVIRQFYFAKGAEKLRSGEENQLLAIEVSRILKANAELRVEIKDLNTTLENYQKSLTNRKSAQDEVAKDLEKYKAIAGITEVEGRGVEIDLDGDPTREQVVDLINALKNIGVEALSINGQRLIISSYISYGSEGLYLDGKKLEKPYVIEVIGDSKLIKESLERAGGIIEQIKEENREIKITVNEKEKIILGAHQAK